MPNLPLTGVQLVAQNAPQFQAAMNAAQQTVQRLQASIQKAAQNSPGLQKAFDLVGRAASGMANLVSSAAQLILTAIGSIITIIGVVLVAAIGAAVAAIGGLFALAKNAAPLGDIASAFERVTSAAGLVSDALVGNLQKASLGTISRFNLLKATNEALIGTTQDLGTELGKNLPALMGLALRQADATGKDTLQIFQGLVEGIRRGTPRMIESAGVLIDIDAANRKFATSVGTTVAALNDEQKSLALLDAVVQQVNTSTGLLGQSTVDAGDLMSRIGATITNIVDGVGLALQPAFETILTIVDTALTGVATFIENSLPYIEGIASLISDALAPVLGTVTGFADQLSSPDVAKRFFLGAVNSFGAFVAGVQQAAVSIINIVTGIAKAIADLLLGASPPPKGPLSKMETGAAATMQSWLTGFIGGFDLDPVEKVAAQVQAAMGSIATAGRGQVEARLAALDKAVQPFQDRLSIVKSTFDAINAAAQPALDAIDRQLAKATETLLQGITGSDATVRALDLQRDAIQGVVDAQQDVTDQAQIQLALVQAQQAQERALLTIRQRQLGPVEKVVAATKKATSPKGPAEPKPKKEKEPSGSGTPGASSPGLGAGGVTGEDLKNIDSAASKAAQAKQQLSDAFQQGLGGAGGALDTTGLDAQIKRIQSVSGTNNVAAKGFEAIKASIEAFAKDPLKGVDITVLGIKIHDGVTKSINDAGGIDFSTTTLYTSLSDLPNQMPADLPTRVFDWVKKNVNGYVQNALNDPIDFVGSLFYMKLDDLSWLPVLKDKLAEFGTWANDNILTPLENATVAALKGVVDYLVTTSGTPGTLLYFFTTTLPTQLISAINSLPLVLGTALTAVADAFNSKIVIPIEGYVLGLLNSLSLFFAGTDEGSLSWIVNAGVQFFIDLPGRLIAAVGGIGKTFWDAFAVPIITVFNGVLDAISGFIHTLGTQLVTGLFQPIINALGIFGPAASAAQQNIAKAGNDIIAAINGLSFPHVSTAFPGGAKGGIFGPGMMRVGERGTELVTSATRKAVFPHTVVRALETIAAGRANVPMMSAGMVSNSSSTTYDRSMTNYFSGVDGERSVARRLAMMRAFG